MSGKRKKKKDTFRVLADAMEKYLSEKGWKVIVVGQTSIASLPRKYMYEFRIKFLGGNSKKL